MIPFLLAGLFVGMANVVPGVSGGTFLLIFGVHPFLIETISSISIKKRMLGLNRPAIVKIAWIILGAAIGIVGMARVMGFLLDFSTSMVYMFFFGLIAGSLDPIWEKMDQRRWQTLLWAAAGFVLIIILAFFSLMYAGGQGQQTLEQSQARWMHASLSLWMGGIVAAATMLIPGVSGSMLLVVFGLYQPIVEAVADFRLIQILIIGVGAILGLWLSAKVFHKMMKRFSNATFSVLLGMVLGSLFLLWIMKGEIDSGSGWLFVGISALIGFIVGRVFQKIHRFHIA